MNVSQDVIRKEVDDYVGPSEENSHLYLDVVRKITDGS